MRLTKHNAQKSIQLKLKTYKNAGVSISYGQIGARLGKHRQWVFDAVTDPAYHVTVPRLIEISDAIDAIIKEREDALNSIKTSN